jgi:hypothetical protein
MYQRVISPQEGQQKLEEIHNQIKQNAPAASWAPIKIAGVSRFEDPFAPWLKDILLKAGLQYDDFNFSFAKSCDLREGQALLVWFEQIRAWASQSPDWVEYMKFITARLLDLSPEAQTVETL